MNSILAYIGCPTLLPEFVFVPKTGKFVPSAAQFVPRVFKFVPQVLKFIPRGLKFVYSRGFRLVSTMRLSMTSS